MAISAPGVGSGLDVNSIVTQLVAIEKQPLQALQAKASTFQSQLSLYSKVKSQTSALGDAAAVLAGATGWSTQKAVSSNPAAVGVTAGSAAVAAALTIEVQQLARAQSVASVGVATGVAVGSSGSLNIELGSWSDDPVPVFTPGTSVQVAIGAADTVATIASKINAAGAGVTATVLRDGTNERLVIRSNSSGVAAGFRLNVPADPGLTALGLTNPSDGVGFVGQTALDAKVKVNGVSVQSATNKMTDVIPGVTLQLNQATVAPVEITVANDLEATQKNIQTFVDAYNALNQTLADATKYDAATKKAGLLQSDSTTVGLQNALRSILGSSSVGSTMTRLSDAGLERQTDGSLKVNSTKLTSALQDVDNLKKLFTTDNSNPLTNGFGLKVRDFARGLVAFDGLVTNKSTALQGSISRNSKDQDRVNDRASRIEVQLRKQYTALDAQMAQMSGLSSYVTAQLAQWNKSTG
ncbi:flagellar filament capping protein FliD [Rhodoferax sp.]|uniref:flagellar filament capping protein FliD n=1 Tax=Rhodoferax sp. TaxID=50421 RepID=UPI001ED3A148|nr:flagellar filament capping protein FliD [Rhodoferax sp.]MBT9507688.1 flagellar filament capping protein FliD [Rhodoferax sp.]